MAKQISQTMFDEVVRENISEFDMDADEAVSDAVQQFESQGVDLSTIVKDLSLYSAGDGGHPVITAITKLSTLLDSEGVDIDSIKSLLEIVRRECNIDLAHRCLAGKNNSFPTLLALSRKYVSNSDVLAASLLSMSSLLNGQPDVVTGESITFFVDLLKNQENDTAVALNLLKVIRFSCLMHESNRQTFVAGDLIPVLVSVMNRNKNNGKIVIEACGCLRTLTLDDDVRVPFGKAHEHAKMIVTEADALKTILQICKEYINDKDVLSELFATLSKLAVRNEFCQEILDLGGLNLMVSTLEQNMSQRALTKQVLGVLQAIAGNDDVKVAIVAAGAAELILAAISKHQMEAGICEIGCAALATIVLRHPTNCKRVIDAGGADVIMKSMQIHQGAPRVQKQACMVIRNLVGRTPNYSQGFLDLGAESLLNQACANHKDCHDEAKAALRDLGCQVELKCPWKGEGRTIAR